MGNVDNVFLLWWQNARENHGYEEMKLSENFELHELIKSQIAERKGISNNPSTDQINNLKDLCLNVLQPIRSHFDSPVVISSGYRSP